MRLCAAQECNPPYCQNIIRSTTIEDIPLTYESGLWTSPEVEVRFHDAFAATHQVLVDTGPAVSVVTRRFVTANNLEHLLIPSPWKMETNWGRMEDYAAIDVFLPNAVMPDGKLVTCHATQYFGVLDKPHLDIDYILGTEFLGSQAADVSYATRSLALGRCGGARTKLTLPRGWPDLDETEKDRLWRIIKVTTYDLFRGTIQSIQSASSDILEVSGSY